MAFAVDARTTAAARPVSTWHTKSRMTASRSMAQAICAVCRNTLGSRAHMAVKVASPSGFFP